MPTAKPEPRVDNADAIVDSALALPIGRRADLAARLLDSLGARENAPDAFSAEFADEVERRSAEMDSGAVVGIPWSEVRAELRSRITRKSEP